MTTTRRRFSVFTIIALLALTAALVGASLAPSSALASTSSQDRWTKLEKKYLKDSTVNQLLEVKYKGGSKARVVLRQKQKGKWKTVLACKGYVGKAGIGKARETSTRTPSGDFGITHAFGIKKDPGAKLPYVRVKSYHWWCSDRKYYNQLIDIRKKRHHCDGEHLIKIKPHYNYGLFFDYNTNPVKYGAGSAFFVHCKHGEPYTEGCVAVSQSNMVNIIRTVEPGARLLIYKK